MKPIGKKMWRWYNVVGAFLLTAGLAAGSFYSCNKNSNQSHTDPFAEPRNATVTMQLLQRDSTRRFGISKEQAAPNQQPAQQGRSGKDTSNWVPKIKDTADD